MTNEEVAKVNRMLYRPLKDGKQYESVIPKFERTVVNFDKHSDNNNTFKTLEFMEHWKQKNSYQCAKLAKMLVGKNTYETCNNIYQFLYWHFQYKLDGDLQDLRKLSAAWHYRKEGMDCKSYSLLAAMILEILNIDCAFRMVQLGSPVWSHVYVVVPDGQKYYVIDATTHNNKEVRYSIKYDRIMRHRGLGSPITITGLGCSCQGTAITKSGLGNPVTLAHSIKNFHEFLNQLEQKGVSRTVTNSMLEIVKANVKAGIDPNMNEVYTKAISMNPGRLGFNIGQTGTAITGAINGEPDSIKYLVSQIIPVSFIGSTFGAVFANGFDLSCWGASLMPAKAADNIKKNHVPHFNYRINTIANATNNNDLQGAINLFIKDVYTLEKYYKVYKPVSASWSGCAKKGIEKYQQFMLGLKIKADLLVDDFKAKGATVATEKLMPLDFWFRKSVTGNADIDEIRNEAATAFVDFPQLDLRNVRVAAPPAISNGTGAETFPAPAYTTPTVNPNDLRFVENADGTVTVTHIPSGETATVSKEEAIQMGYKPKAKSNVVPIVLGGAALAFFLFQPKGDMTKLKPQTTNKTKKK